LTTLKKGGILSLNNNTRGVVMKEKYNEIKLQIMFNEGYLINQELYNRASELFKSNYSMNISPEECKILEETIFAEYLSELEESLK